MRSEKYCSSPFDRSLPSIRSLPEIHEWLAPSMPLRPASPPVFGINHQIEGVSDKIHDGVCHLAPLITTVSPLPMLLSMRQQAPQISRESSPSNFLSGQRYDGPMSDQFHSSDVIPGPGVSLVIDEAYDNGGIYDAKKIIESAFCHWRGTDLIDVWTTKKGTCSLSENEGLEINDPLNGKNKQQMNARNGEVEDVRQRINEACSLLEVRKDLSQHDMKPNIRRCSEDLRATLSHPRHCRVVEKLATEEKINFLSKLDEAILWSSEREATSAEDYEHYRRSVKNVATAMQKSYSHTLKERDRRTNHSRYMCGMIEACPAAIHDLAVKVHPFREGSAPSKYFIFLATRLQLEFHDHTIRTLLGEKEDQEQRWKDQESQIQYLRQQQQQQQQQPSYNDSYPLKGDYACRCSPFKRRRLPSPSSTESWTQVSRSSKSP